jgi:hypothetical protein
MRLIKHRLKKPINSKKIRRRNFYTIKFFKLMLKLLKIKLATA